jgi:hypothetical protein
MMSSKDFGEDSAFLLYLVPVVASIIYGAYEWAITASTSTMPPNAYLIVSKSPYLFLISVAAICAAIILEVRSAKLQERHRIVQENSLRLQILAIAVLVISLAAATSAANYDFGNTFYYFVNGRYAFIYAFFLIGISLLLAPKQVLGNVKLSSIPDVIGLLLVAGSPVLFYLALKVNLSFTVSAVGSLLIAIIGSALLLAGSNLVGKKGQKPATPTQDTTPETSRTK